MTYGRFLFRRELKLLTGKESMSRPYFNDEEFNRRDAKSTDDDDDEARVIA